MISVLKKVLPDNLVSFLRSIKTNLELIRDFWYDYRRFSKYACLNKFQNREHYQAFLIKEYHAIEKGLALRFPKPGFGKERISKLIIVLKEYLNNYSKDDTTDATAAALLEYVNFEIEVNKRDSLLIKNINNLLSEYSIPPNIEKIGGTKIVNRNDILSSINFDFSTFFKSRFSTRDFTDEPVSNQLIQNAVSVAMYTPSVCNRQAWKVYHISSENKDLRDRFLKVQNGNRGFGEYIGSLLIITGKLSSFFPFERNQVFIDGGMFAMSLVMALHSKGLGTCCLNTSYTADRSEEFYKVMEMDTDCVPIMFIAVGHLKSEYRVAVSHRKMLSEVFQTY